MNIQLFDTKSNKPIANTKIQIQIKGKENGLLWVNNNYNGSFELEKKYADHQISVPSLESKSVQAKEGAILRCEIDDKKSAKQDYQKQDNQHQKHKKPQTFSQDFTPETKNNLELKLELQEMVWWVLNRFVGCLDLQQNSKQLFQARQIC